MNTSEPTQLEIVRAATNDPSLSTRSVKLGDRVFKLVDLPYDDYMLFMASVQPLIEALLGSLPGVKAAGIMDTLTPASLVSYCGKALPEMCRIVCSQTDPDISVAEIKLLGKTPFALAAVVLAQVDQNGIINEIKSFFQQVMPLMRAALPPK